jgi:AcrR family transcriptional regulator
MLRPGKPFTRHAIERLHRHPGVGRKEQFLHALLAEGLQRRRIVLEQRLERLALPERGVLRRQVLDVIDQEEHLRLQRVLAPERPVVVERSDAIGERNVPRTARLRHARDEIDDHGFRRAIVPGVQHVSRAGPRQATDASPRDAASEASAGVVSS